MSQIQYAQLPALPYATPLLASSRERLIRASDHLWRVHNDEDRVLGHLRVIADTLGLRYRAERLHLTTGVFHLVGEFWCADDAVFALRNG